MYSYRIFALGYFITFVCADLNNLLNRGVNGDEYSWYRDMRKTSDGEDCDTTRSLAAAQMSEHINVLISIEPFNTSIATTSLNVEDVTTTLTATVTLMETMTALAQTAPDVANTITSIITIGNTITMSAISTSTITLPAMSSAPDVAGKMSDPLASSIVTTNPTTISILTSSLLYTSHPTTSSVLTGISFSLVTNLSNKANTTMNNTTMSPHTSRSSGLPAISVANNSDKFTLKPSTRSVTAAMPTANTGSKVGDPFRAL